MSEIEPTRAPLPTAIYVRISRDRAGAGLGVDRQEADCRALAERLGWDVIAIYSDNDVSAASGKPRPQYRAMLDAVRAGQVRGIIAWHTDRLHRRPTELEEFITLAESHAIQIQTVKAGTIDLSTPSGQMVARMLGAAARHEVDQMKARIRREKEAAAAAGKYRGGMRPFGYEKDGVTVRESEAQIVRESIAAILSGRTLASVARELRERGVTGTNGKPVTYGNMRDMLMRPRNAGILATGLPNRNATTNNSTRPYEEIGPASWPAIVPEEQWRAFVTLMCDPSRVLNEGQRETKWLGSGIYRCGVPTGEVDAEGEPIVCNGTVKAAPHGGTKMKPYTRRYLYRCTASAHLTVRQDQTDDFVRGVVAEMIRDPRIAAALHPSDLGLTADRERRAELSRRLESFERDYALGDISGAQLRKATEAVTAEIDAVDARMAKTLRHSVSADILRAADPGQAFLDAPIDVQRAVLATVLRVEVVPQARRGTAWSPDRLKLTPAV